MKEIDDNDVIAFTDIIRTISVYDFAGYSDKSLKRRIARILFDNNLDFPAFLEKIKQDPVFLEKVVKNITVNTTELFRDPPVWNSIRNQILPLFKNNKMINIWHAGCSTGQEVYSMLILLHELGLFERSHLFATDINSDVLEIAREGTYHYQYNLNYLDNFDKVIRHNPAGENKDYSDYFLIDETKDRITMKPFLVNKPVYQKMDLVKDSNPFPAEFDLIICRNVIIYFNYELQNKVFRLFYNNLNSGGYLILGVHETILGPFSVYFENKFQGYFKK